MATISPNLPELADTLEAINGTDAFYTGSRIAPSIVDTVNASGRIMTLEDLHTYTVKLEEPLRTQYNGKFNGSTVSDRASAGLSLEVVRSYCVVIKTTPTLA